MADDEHSPDLLLNGTLPARADQVLALCAELGITQHTRRHPALHTVADSKAHRTRVDGGYSKNLFLRNKRGRMWLLTLHEDRLLDLRALGERLGAGRLSFASTRRLMSYLGVLPGAVTPLAVINDHSRAVQAVLDRRLLRFSELHFHPCDNTCTTTLASVDLLRFMAHCGHPPELIDCDRFAL